MEAICVLSSDDDESAGPAAVGAPAEGAAVVLSSDEDETDAIAAQLDAIAATDPRPQQLSTGDMISSRTMKQLRALVGSMHALPPGHSNPSDKASMMELLRNAEGFNLLKAAASDRLDPLSTLHLACVLLGAHYQNSRRASAHANSTQASSWAKGTGFGGSGSGGGSSKSAEKTAAERECWLNDREQLALEAVAQIVEQLSSELMLGVCKGLLIKLKVVAVVQKILSSSLNQAQDRPGLTEAALHTVEAFTKEQTMSALLVGPSDGAEPAAAHQTATLRSDATVKTVLGELAKQATVFLGLPLNQSTQQAKRSAKLCKLIVKCHKATYGIKARRKRRRRGGDEVEAVKEDPLHIRYVDELRPLALQSTELFEKSDVHFAYSKEAAAGKNPSAAWAQRVGREVSSLASTLPVEFGSSIFVCVDEERLDVMKVLVVGPEDTPYQNGLFVFDVHLPSTYPAVPPKVLLKTTGKGSVRFNPNLYNCGKVCLSLLGTWQGPGWDKKSSLMQVLISIQSLILVPQPYFNEPGFEASMGTPQGDAQSSNYNATIREATLKWAILEQLRHPPKGFEKIVATHFKLKRRQLEQQIEIWQQEAMLNGHSTHTHMQALLTHDVFDQVSSSARSLAIVASELRQELHQLGVSQRPRKRNHAGLVETVQID